MPTVFLSYAREDLPLIELLEAQLKEHPDISIWRDQKKIYGGQNWPKILGEAIANQDIFLLAWSKHSAASHSVENEWSIAIAHEKTIVPYFLDETPLPAALKAFHGYHRDDAAGLITSLRSALLGDVQRREPVFRKPSAITTTEEIAVPSQAKTAFAQQQWTVQKSQAYATLAATILTIIISIFVINEKFLATPLPPTIVAPAPEGKSEMTEDPLYAMQHLEKGDGKGEPVRSDVQSDIERVSALRDELDHKINGN